MYSLQLTPEQALKQRLQQDMEWRRQSVEEQPSPDCTAAQKKDCDGVPTNTVKGTIQIPKPEVATPENTVQSYGGDSPQNWNQDEKGQEEVQELSKPGTER